MVFVLLLPDKTGLRRHCTHQSFRRSQLSCILCIFLDHMHRERLFPPHSSLSYSALFPSFAPLLSLLFPHFLTFFTPLSSTSL